MTPVEWATHVIDSAIADTTRPIDSVRHQAKTVTVGTTRAGYSVGSVTAQALRGLGTALDDVPIRIQQLLGLLDEVLASIAGGVRYGVAGSAGLRHQVERANLRVITKTGCSSDRPSRFENGAPVSGTKAVALRCRQALLVRGIRDDVPILVFPLLKNGCPSEVILLHLQFKTQISLTVRESLLNALPQRREALQAVLEEASGRPVTAAEIARLPLDILLFATPEQAATLSAIGA
jgi:glucosamine--fructose-6-phosphate aminotransferase (isomerizing)